ncbi:MAG: NADPH-dependent F420 reductase [Burkholderiaceae bacterium]|nr:NADPH-dependent F420 reductase [Burkholderiaceae bacterium]
MSEKRPTLAFIGGTGDLGSGLAWRFARVGFPIVIGSRLADRAIKAAESLSATFARGFAGMANIEAARAGDIVFMSVPFENHRTTLESIGSEVRGKIFVDTTVPLVPPKVMRVQLPAEGCVGKRTQNLLGAEVRVVSAFQNVAAAHLKSEAETLPGCDVPVSGDDADAREVVVRLAEEIGFKAWHAGPIDNAAVAEALTSVLIFMNKRYGIAGAGIKIGGTPTKI